MNFEYMPELGWKWGYAGAWGLMLAVGIGMYFWIKRRGWW
jgi:magnesium transporter